MTDWQPAATTQTLKLRARLLATVRQFFAERDVIEVETPLLARHTVSDVNLESFVVNSASSSGHGTLRSSHSFLQTSPEYAMKRLLAAGSGPIYQICKAFRDEEPSRLHNPEFTLLEWYRPGLTLEQLMDEVVELMQAVLKVGDIARFSYRQVFAEHLQIDPHTIDPDELQELTREKIDLGDTQLTATDCLQFLMHHCIEPELPKFCIVYDYPVAQAALAETAQDANGQEVARRFEVYAAGMELANAYQELTDAEEQRRRFAADQQLREKRGLPVNPVDENLLAALEHGLPACSGIALGIDRLLMAVADENDIKVVLAFDRDRA